MKKLLILSSFLCLFISCNEKKECCKAGNSQECESDQKHSADATHDGVVSDMSIYNLDSEWTNQNNQKVKLEGFVGKPQLITLIYTTCAYACPRIMADIKGIEEKLTEKGIQDYGIVLVTMDPENDTPKQLKKFAKEQGLNESRYQLLNSESENIRELSVLLNIKYKKLDSGDISHSNIISVLNSKGEIVYQEEGLGADPEETVKKVSELVLAKKQ
jgi:protein SCO1/2